MKFKTLFLFFSLIVYSADDFKDLSTKEFNELVNSTDNLEELYIIESGKHKGYLPDYYDTTRTIKYINDYDEYNRLSEVRFNSNGNTCKMIYEYLGEKYLNDYGVKYFTNDTLLHQIQYDLNDKIVVDYIVVDGEVIGGLRHFYK